MGAFKTPHGGELKDLYLSPADAEAEKITARDYPSWDLTPRQICDIELLLNGAFSPLEGFLAQADYESVVKNMRLADGTLWPMPITLDVSDSFAGSLNGGDVIALRDPEGVLIATMELDATPFATRSRNSAATKAYGTDWGPVHAPPFSSGVCCGSATRNAWSRSRLP